MDIWIKTIEEYCKGRGIEVGCSDVPLKINTIRTDLRPLQYSAKRKAFRNSAADIFSDCHVLDGFAPRHFDFIVSQHVIEHLVNPIKALLRWKELLRPGGVVLALVPTYDKATPITDYVERYNKDPDTSELHLDHPNQFTPDTLAELSTLCGYRIQTGQQIAIVKNIHDQDVPVYMIILKKEGE